MAGGFKPRRFVSKGQRFGKLVVVDPDSGRAKDRSRLALMLCDCGVSKPMRVKLLANGLVTSCGCGRGVPRVFVAKGQRFGRLVVLDPEVPVARRRLPRQRSAEVRCDCGTVTVATINNLVHGIVKSCGCAARSPSLTAVPGRPASLAVGQRFGKLVVLDPDAGRTTDGKRRVTVECDCGAIKTARQRDLIRGNTKSCGCLKREAKPPWTKGKPSRRSRHPLYGVWAGMMARCYRETSPAYRWYGARGITVCKAWHDSATFITEIEASIGPRPSGAIEGKRRRPLWTLDRVDNDSGYRPGNVRWALPAQQTANRRRMIGSEREFVHAPDTDMYCPTCGEPQRSLTAFDKHRKAAHGGAAKTGSSKASGQAA